MSALHQAARQSFAFDVAGRENLLTGLAYVGLGMRLGGLVGAVAAGYLIDGPGAHMAYWMLASGYIVSTLLLSFIRSPGQAAARSRQPIMENLREFVGELRRNNPLLTLVVIVAATETLGFSSGATLPSLARDVLNVGAEGLGWLNGFRSGGAVVAILLLSLFGEVGRRGALLLLNLLVFGAALVLLGQSPVVATFLPGGGTSGESASLILGQSPAFVIALLATGIVGGAMAMSDIFSQSMMQNIVPNEQRGRAMGAWIVGIGTAPIGNLQVGAILKAAGVGIALSVNGIALALVGAAIFAFYGRCAGCKYRLPYIINVRETAFETRQHITAVQSVIAGQRSHSAARRMHIHAARVRMEHPYQSRAVTQPHSCFVVHFSHAVTR